MSYRKYFSSLFVLLKKTLARQVISLAWAIEQHFRRTLGIECCDSKKLVTMEFSSSKEPVLRILATYFNPENEANVWFPNTMLHLPINKGCNAKCKPSTLPPALNQTCQLRPYYILTGRQSGQKLQCLYGNPMANDFFQNWILPNLWIAMLKY